MVNHEIYVLERERFAIFHMQFLVEKQTMSMCQWIEERKERGNKSERNRDEIKTTNEVPIYVYIIFLRPGFIHTLELYKIFLCPYHKVSLAFF